MTTAEEYRTASSTLFDRAMVELDADELLKASESLWEAAIRALKSLDERRGWRHDSPHGEFYKTLNRLEEEMDVAELSMQFAFALDVRLNSYENWLDIEEIRYRAAHIQRFISTVSGL